MPPVRRVMTLPEVVEEEFCSLLERIDVLVGAPHGAARLVKGQWRNAAERFVRGRPSHSELPPRPPIRAWRLTEWDELAVYVLFTERSKLDALVLHFAIVEGVRPPDLSDNAWDFARARYRSPETLGPRARLFRWH